MKHFREFTSDENRITLKVNGLSYTGIETVAYFLIADRLM